MAAAVTVLLYNVDKKKKQNLQFLLFKLGYRSKSVAPSDYGKTIGSLLGLTACPETPSEENRGDDSLEFKKDMLLIAGLPDAKLGLFVDLMKNAGVGIAYNAALTEHNQLWDSRKLYAELEAEYSET